MHLQLVNNLFMMFHTLSSWKVSNLNVNLVQMDQENKKKNSKKIGNGKLSLINYNKENRKV